MSFTAITSRLRKYVLVAPARANSHQDLLRQTSEIPHVLERLIKSLVTEGFPHRDVLAVRQAVVEALVNAIEHGNGGNSLKCVHVGYVYLCRSQSLLITIQDEGNGFDPDLVPAPRWDKYLGRPAGNGLRIMKYLMTWVRFNERGNSVTMCKRRSRIR